LPEQTLPDQVMDMHRYLTHRFMHNNLPVM